MHNDHPPDVGVVATCENYDCGDDSRFPLEDGDSMEPARCPFCDTPYTIRSDPPDEREQSYEGNHANTYVCPICGAAEPHHQCNYYEGSQ